MERARLVRPGVVGGELGVTLVADRPGLSLAEELTEEAEHLGRRLGHRVLALPGAVGVLNPHARAVVSVYGPRVDQPALLREVAAVPVRPQLNVLDGVEVDADDLARRGWRRQGSCTHVVASTAGLRTTVRLERVLEPTLPEAVAVMDAAFGVADSDEVLPAGVTRVPGLALFLDRDEAGRAHGVVGVRLRRRGALVFGLGVLADGRRRGTGRRLVEGAAGWARLHGRTELHAHAEQDSLPFWSRTGFAPRGRWTAFDPVG